MAIYFLDHLGSFGHLRRDSTAPRLPAPAWRPPGKPPRQPGWLIQGNNPGSLTIRQPHYPALHHLRQGRRRHSTRTTDAIASRVSHSFATNVARAWVLILNNSGLNLNSCGPRQNSSGVLSLPPEVRTKNSCLARLIMALVEFHEFPEGGEPEVLTTISTECSGGQHDSCPGILSLPGYKDELVFCICACHKVPESELPS